MHRRLYRSRKHNMLLGVCGGLAEHLNVDPTVIRLAAVLLTFFDGLGLLAYIVLAVIMPVEEGGATKKSADASSAGEDLADIEQLIENVERTIDEASARLEKSIGKSVRENPKPHHARRSRWLGFALVLGGLWILARNLNLFDGLAWGITWAFRPSWEYVLPIGLVVLGVVLVLAERRRRHD